jgi:hypothetical protein
MNLQQLRIRLAIWLLAVPSLVFGQPVPALDVTELVRNSEVIAVGAVQSVSDQGMTFIDVQGQRTKARSLTAEMLVDQTLKGTTDRVTVHVRFVAPEVQVGYRTVSPSSYRLVFLKRQREWYEFVSPYYPALLAVPMPTIEGADPAVKVGAAIAAVIESPSTSPTEKRAAIFQLSRLNSSISIGALRRALDQSNEDVRLSAAAALLELNDVSGLPAAEKALLGDQNALNDAIAHNLRHGLSEGLTAEGAIPALARLLTSSDNRTRRAAASGLRRTRSPSALQVLATALDDADWEVRYYAVIGLAEISGENAWRPDVDTFRRSEERYVSYWKERSKRGK